MIDFGTSVKFQTKMLTKQAGTAFYIAPEVIHKNYNNKADIWSIGVILYIMMCGRPPFCGNNEDEIFHKTTMGHVDFNDTEWKIVSKSCKDLITNLLCLNPDKRFSAAQALEHAWIVENTKEGINYTIETKLSLNNLKKFTNHNKFQQAVVVYMAQKAFTNEEKDRLEELFESLDKNADGQLQKNELIDGYAELYDDKEFAIKEVERIFQNVDVNHNGAIDFSEFLMANMQKQNIMHKDMLKAAFSEFDTDGNGVITLDELENVFQLPSSSNREHQKEDVIKLFNAVDTNHDGNVDFDEFLKMMENMQI